MTFALFIFSFLDNLGVWVLQSVELFRICRILSCCFLCCRRTTAAAFCCSCRSTHTCHTCSRKGFLQCAMCTVCNVLAHSSYWSQLAVGWVRLRAVDEWSPSRNCARNCANFAHSNCCCRSTHTCSRKGFALCLHTAGTLHYLIFSVGLSSSSSSGCAIPLPLCMHRAHICHSQWWNAHSCCWWSAHACSRKGSASKQIAVNNNLYLNETASLFFTQNMTKCVLFQANPILGKTMCYRSILQLAMKVEKHRKNCECCPVSQLIVR